LPLFMQPRQNGCDSMWCATASTLFGRWTQCYKLTRLAKFSSREAQLLGQSDCLLEVMLAHTVAVLSTQF
jgi:hypothetical protein